MDSHSITKSQGVSRSSHVIKPPPETFWHTCLALVLGVGNTILWAVAMYMFVR